MTPPVPVRLPITAAYAVYHAQETPEKPALIAGDQIVTFRQFARDLARLRDAFAALGVARGQTVGLEHGNLYLHWLMILACELLGAASYTYRAADLRDEEAVLGAADFIAHSAGTPPHASTQTLAIDQAWVDGVLAREPAPLPATIDVDPDQALRVVRGSGTTGAPKRMVYTAAIQAHWLRQYQFRMGFGRASRYLIGTGFHVETYHVFATACLRAGGTCIFNPGAGNVDNLASHGITHFSCIPDTLVRMLGEVPADRGRPDNLTVLAGGAPISNAVREQVRARLATTLLENYGSTETGTACAMGPDGIGHVVPGATVQVVDDDDRPVIGQAGQIRIRSDGIVGGYLDDPEATARMFRGGWFYPGDEGEMLDARTMKFIGRSDDLINVRGYKFLPQPLEERLAAHLPVRDVCVLEVPDARGATALWIAFVPAGADAAPAIKELAGPLVPAEYGRVGLTAVAAIPRTASGKIRRNELRRQLTRSQET